MTRKTVDEHLMSLRARQAAALQRAASARTAISRFERKMASLSRRKETQRLCTLGRAWEALGEQNQGFRQAGKKFLVGYISRETDHEILRGTPWEIPEASAPEEDLDNE